jgi:hypothetical protein
MSANVSDQGMRHPPDDPGAAAMADRRTGGVDCTIWSHYSRA